MLSKPFTYLNLSDIHFFHSLTPTEYTTESLTEYFDDFKPTSRFAGLDMILFGGDITDDRRDFKDPCVYLMKEWFYRLMVFCCEHDIALRILRGTPSHEYDQSRNLIPMAMAFGNKLDFKYIDVLHIEHHDKWDIDILYVPDEWAGSAQICQTQVTKLLADKGLDKVDIACMHGMFDYQLPELGEHKLKHDSKFYLDIVKYFINIGHVHRCTTFDRILAQGSFERLAHGEEEKKGGILCCIDPNKESRFEFIENKRAKIFKTVNVKTKDLDKAIEQVSKVADTLPERSHIRISCTKDHPILNSLQAFKLSYPLLYWKTDKKDKDDKPAADAFSELMNIQADYIPISITKDTIVQQIMDKVLSKTDLDGRQQMILSEELGLLK